MPSAEASYTIARPCNLPRDEIYGIAEKVRRLVGYEPGGDIEAVVGRLGGRLEYKDFWRVEEGNSGSLMVDGEKDFVVYIATNTSAARDRFTIAHEIGHYVLHFYWPRLKGANIEKMLAKRYGSEREEWEANWFAAAFLMPEELFTEAYRTNGQNLRAVAQRFGVSEEAARVRAKALRLW